MTIPETLQSIFNRIESGKRLGQQDLQTLVAAVRSQQVTLATGDRAVAIGGNADGAVIVTGDHTIIISDSDAEAIRSLISSRSRSERLLLQAVGIEVASRLKQTLINHALIQLGMELQPEQVWKPWDLEIENSSKSSEVLPEYTNIVEVFDNLEIGGNLLILGDPGSGKTTTLLELAQALVVRAKHSPDYPIPVLFNLSSWRKINFLSKNFLRLTRQFVENDHRIMNEWLVNELKSKYGVRTDIGRQWLKEDKLLPLLDGLDEVQERNLEPCIKDINEFLQSENRTSCLVVCSRISPYSSSLTRLNLNNSICLKPLTKNQILNYLSSQSYPELWETINGESKFIEIVQTPLILALTVLAYQKALTQNLSEAKSLEVLKELDPLQVESIRELIAKTERSRKRNFFYSLQLIIPTEAVSLGELIEVYVELIPHSGTGSRLYLLTVSESEVSKDELSIFLDASGFQFNNDNAASLPLKPGNDNQDHFQASQVSRFALIALRPGSHLIRAEVYLGETFKVALEAEIHVSSVKQLTSHSLIAARSRPVPQPDLILQVQTVWNENLSTCTFRYHLDSFHPRLSFASDMQQQSGALTAGWLEQTRNLLQATLEDTASSLPEDFRSRLSSLGQYLFQQLLPLELQDTLHSVRGCLKSPAIA